jgi:hypothetical protein
MTDIIMSDNSFEVLKEIRDDLKYVRDLVVGNDVMIHTIVGNGQPGRLTLLEKEVETLKALKWKMIGMVTLLSFIMEIFHVGGSKLISLIK